MCVLAVTFVAIGTAAAMAEPQSVYERYTTGDIAPYQRFFRDNVLTQEADPTVAADDAMKR